MFILLKTLLAFSVVASPISSMYEIGDNNKNTNLEKYKDDISLYKIKKEKLKIMKSEPDLKIFVYMQMAENNPNYSEFFFDLLLNRDMYLVSGDGFKIPKDPDGEKYKITVYAKPNNSDFFGKLSFELILVPKKEKIDLSEFSQNFDKNDKTKQANVVVNKSDITASLNIQKKDVLKAVDEYFVKLGIEVWNHTTSNKLLQDNINQIDVTIDKPYQIFGYIEAYYKVVISPKKENTQFLPYILTTYIHVEFNYKTILKNTNHDIYSGLGSNWSSFEKYYWGNNSIWYKALNLKDYISKNELITSKGDYKKAFASKYDYITFNVLGYAKDYDDKIWKLKNPIFSLQEIENGKELKGEIVTFAKSGFGVASEVDNFIFIRINKNLDLEYKIHAYVGVKGFGAKFQYTILKSNVFQWVIS